MAMRLRLLSAFPAIVAVLLLGCSSGSSSSPSHRVGSDYPVPQGPASINGLDAGSYPHLALAVPALPHCDGGESYVPADGGGMQCGIASGGGVSYCDAGANGSGITVPFDGGIACLPTPIHLGTIEVHGDAGELVQINSSHNLAPMFAQAGRGLTVDAGPPLSYSLGVCDAGEAWIGGDGGMLCRVAGGGAVSSVTGAGSTVCSPTTGGVTCTTANTLANGQTAADLSGCSSGEIVSVGSSALSCEATVPVSAGGTGAAPTCVGGDLVMASSSTAMACVASSGDVSYAAGGAATVTSLQAGEIAVGGSTGALTAASTATAPGLAQVSESATQTPTIMAFAPQPSTHATNQDSSGIDIDLTAPLGTGVDAYTVFRRGGVAQVTIGTFPGGAGQGIWFGVDRSAVTTGNWAFLNYPGGGTYLSALSGLTLFLEVGNTSAVGEQLFASGAGFSGNVTIGTITGGTSGGGTNEAIFTNGTAPTSACTGGTCVNSTTSGLIATSAVGDVDTMQAVTVGTVASQTLKHGRQRCVGSSTTGASVVCSWTVPKGPGATLSIWSRVSCTNSLGACNTSGSGAFSSTTIIGQAIKNPGGSSVSVLATNPTPVTSGDVVTGLSCVLSTSGAALVYTCGDLADAATADWAIDAEILGE